MRRAWLALLALPGCGGETPVEPAPEQAAPSPGSDVVARELALLDARVAAEEPPRAAPPEDIEERVLGLLASVASARDSFGALAAEELAGLGDAAVPVLARALGERERAPAERAAAAQSLGTIGTPDALEALLVVLESSRTSVAREPELYAVCAEAIGIPAADWVAPRLALCLKYEVDYPTVVRIADSLARLGLYCGLDALFVIARDARDAVVRGEAEALLERWRGELGAADWFELAEIWNAGQLERLPPPPSGPRYEREVWRAVQRLSEWQLRGVDDARFTLLQLRENAAAILARALGDGDVYVRLHAAQCLARMGPRGRCAVEALVGVLDDRQVGATAAEALGSLGGDVAAAALAARLAPEHGLELRVACARALGRVAPEDLAATLAPWLAADAPLDLSTAAAEALLHSGRAQPGSEAEAAALGIALSALTSGRVEPSTAERALAAWLASRSDLAALLHDWNALGERPEPERYAERGMLLSTWRADQSR